jgi:hypothetical protein
MASQKPLFTYLSLGAGVQSSALYVMALRGHLPRPDVAIFADTGAEPPWVYQIVRRLSAMGQCLDAHYERQR